MNLERLDIIGAGSLGLLLTNLLKDSELKVMVYESKQQIGGVTRDFYNSSGHQFFHGCHYLGDALMPKSLELRNNSLQFIHRYASITEQNKKWNYKLNFAGPSFFLQNLDVNDNLTNCGDINQKLNSYPKEIRNDLKRLVRKVVSCDLSILHPTGLASLGLDRVTVMESESELVTSKKKYPLVDQLFGVRRDLLGLDYEVAHIPKNGYDIFWEALFGDVQNYNNVSFQVNHQINSKNMNRILELPKSSVKLWCADPRYLVRHLKGIKLDSHQYSIVTYGVSLDSYTGPDLPFYINVFSHSTNLLRLYFYETFSNVKLSVESVAPQIETQALCEEIFKILHETNVAITLSDVEIATTRSKRYFPLTNNDYNNLHDTFKILSDTNWLDTGSYIYDRATRYSMIVKQLSQKHIKSE